MLLDFRRNFLLLSLLLLGLVFFLPSCYYDNEEELYQYYYQNQVCDTTTVSFSNTIYPIIQAKCNSCHVVGGNAEGAGLFENYNQVKAKVDNGSFNQRVIVNRDMPPGGGLTDCQFTQMQVWLNLGAPNN